MFCPKCGAESLDGQRFCKSCGTNLQLINNALRGGDGGQFIHGVDVEALKQNAIEFAKSWKEGWSGSVGPGVRAGVMRGRTTREIRRREQEEAKRRNLPRPKEWITYSWQHNLRNGLLSLFWGGGLGVLLYYLGQNAATSDALHDIPNLTANKLDAIQHAARLAWMIAVFPVVKGLAQIIYSAFAESMKTLSDRYTIPPEVEREPQEPALSNETAAPTSYPRLVAPPASVTENTTEFFDQIPVEGRRETQ